MSQARAWQEYKLNVSGAEMVLRDIEKLRPADFYDELPRIQRAVRAYLDHYEKLIHGKTGSEEAERRLRHMWVEMNKHVGTAIENRPSPLSVYTDVVARALSDFLAGAKEAVEGYTSWVKERAHNLIRTYHESVLKLLEAKRRGRNVKEAEKIRAMIQSSFASSTLGKDIDELAQQMFGAYPSLGAAPAVAALWPVAVGIAVVALSIAGLILAFSHLVSSFAGSGPDVMGFALVVLAAILVFRGDRKSG